MNIITKIKEEWYSEFKNEQIHQRTLDIILIGYLSMYLLGAMDIGFVLTMVFGMLVGIVTIYFLPPVNEIVNQWHLEQIDEDNKTYVHEED